MKMLCENKGLKFLIFAYHHNMMDGIAEELHDTNLKYIRIDGHTAAQERPVSNLLTRMHSSRMRTARSPTLTGGGLRQRPPVRTETPSPPAPPPPRDPHPGKRPPPVATMTYACENITLSQTSFAGSKNVI